MIIESFESFALALPKKQAILGIDLGKKSIGLAVSDTELKIATGLKTIKRSKFKIDSLLLGDIINKRKIAGIIIGLPKNMNGSEGRQCQASRAFAQNLSSVFDVHISFWDERLSTVAAERSLLEADLSRKRRSQVIDHVAASFILQGALDRINSLMRKVEFNDEPGLETK